MSNSHIINFIKSLNSEELRISKKYICSDTKISKLLTLLTSEIEISNTSLSKKIGCSTESLRVLKSRLFEKIKEALLDDENFQSQILFSEREKLVFYLKKKVLLAKYLCRTINQNRIETINILIEDIIQVTKEYQIFDVLIEALTLKKQITGQRMGLVAYEKLRREIDFYDRCFRDIRRANDEYYKLVLDHEYTSSLTKDEMMFHIENSIFQMELNFKETGAEEINYHCNIFKLAKAEKAGKFKEAISLCGNILTNLKKSKIIYSNNRMGFALSYLTHYNVYLGNYKKGAKNAENAQRFNVKNSFNYFMLKEQEFFAHFYDKNYSEATKAIVELMQHSDVDAGKFRSSKFIYFHACILFRQNKFRDALKLLSSRLYIEKDKAGWNIYLRITLIMIHIHLNSVAIAGNSINALKKHIGRTIKSKEINGRTDLIIRLLNELVKDSFKRNPKNRKAAKLLQELSYKDGPDAWSHFTPELIPFHEWVMTLPAK